MSTTLSFAPEDVRTADVIVIGSGIAGLMTALHASHREVLIVSKINVCGSNY